MYCANQIADTTTDMPMSGCFASSRMITA